MFLNKLSIYSKSEIIREIEFHRGINLIIDETPDEFKGSIQSTGNNVGKTTVLRLIDYCFGADGKSIYQDTEFKNQPNTTIKDFLKEKEVIIHLELLVDLNDENSEKIVRRRNFLARKKKIQELNGVNYTDNKEFDFELKKIIFKTEVDKPTFRQIISKNIRDEKGKMANIVKVLNPYTSKEEYEALYLFWLGISTETLDEKQRLSAEKTKEENFQKRLKKEGELSLIEQQLRFVSSKILELDKQKENFNLNENYAADIQKLNDVKYALNRVSTELSRLEVRRDLIEESKADLEKEHVEINTSQIKSLYDKANALISNLQVSFEETVKFHNDLITEKLDYITKELPELDKAVDKLRNELNRLRGLEDTLTTKLRNTGVAEDLENIVIELNKQYERKGKLEEQKRLWISSTDKIKNISAKLSEINEKILSKDDLIRLNPEYPGIINNELSINQLLKIKLIDEVNPDENFLFYKDSIQQDATVNLSILLPFKAEEYKKTSYINIFSKEKNSSAPLANMVTDFYTGIEIAVDSIKKQGVDVNVTVLDTGNRGENITTIIDSGKLSDTDVVIGPFYSDKAEIVADKINVPVVFPHFSGKQQHFSSKKLIKSAPDKENYTDYLISYLKENYRGEQVFVVGDGKKSSNKKVNKIVSGLKKHDSITKVHVLKPEKGYIKRALFTKKMTTKKHNWVIITSNDYVAISDVLNSMIGVPDDVTVQIFAIEKNKDYDKIDNNKLASVDFTYVSSSFEDNTSSNVKDFNKKYFAKNNTSPSDYAIKGFDITYDVLVRLASGKELTDTFKEGVSFRLENKFDYHKKNFGSTSNRGLFIIKYNQDLSLTRLK